VEGVLGGVRRETLRRHEEAEHYVQWSNRREPIGWRQNDFISARQSVERTMKVFGRR
jgi:hypothetical protein